MTFVEAASIMIGGGTEPQITYPESITYADDGDYGGILTEHYGDKTKDVKIQFVSKGTINEQIAGLTFYDENGDQVGRVSFSGFYVG